jgi:hypothetical protein
VIATFLQGHVALHLMGLMIIAPFYIIKKRMQSLVRTIDRKVCLMSELYCPYVPLCNGQQIASWIALFDFEKLIMKLKCAERSHGLGVLVLATIAVSAALLGSVIDKSSMATIAVLSVFTMFSITLFFTSFAFAAWTRSIEENLPKAVREQRVRFAVHDSSISTNDAELDTRGVNVSDSLPVPFLATPRLHAPVVPSNAFPSQSPRGPVTPRSNAVATQFSLSHSASHNDTAPFAAQSNLRPMATPIPISPRSKPAAIQIADAQSTFKQMHFEGSNSSHVQVHDVTTAVPSAAAAAAAAAELDLPALLGYLEVETDDKGDGIEQDANISDKLDVMIGYLESNHESLKLLKCIPANFGTLSFIAGYAITAMITAFSFISAYG